MRGATTASAPRLGQPPPRGSTKRSPREACASSTLSGSGRNPACSAGTALLASILAAQLPLAGRVADLGCGIGTLARATLAASTAISELTLIDRDRRAITAARLNVPDARARFTWSDVRAHAGGLADLDAVVMNPPFHDGGAEDRALGQDFVRIAAHMLRRGGRCVLVANRHLPYEGILASAFRSVTLLADRAGYKVYEAVK